MSIPLTVQGVTFQYPVSGDELWGREATNWAIAVTNALTTLTVTGDIGPTTLAAINNNVSTPTNVSQLNVSVANVRAFMVQYYVYRGRGSPTNEELVETGTLRAIYAPSAGAWTLDNTYTGDSDVEFNITAAGQVQYTSSNIAGSGTYFGQMRYRLFALPV